MNSKNWIDKHWLVDMRSGGFASVRELDINNYQLSLFALNNGGTVDANPSSLFAMKSINGGLKRSLGLRFGREPSLLRQFRLSLVAPLGFAESSARDIHSIFSSVGRNLRNSSLPYSNADGAESSDHQRAGEPSQSLIRFDLRSCELVLFVLASLAGDLFLTLRSIKNDRTSFLVEGGGFVILFLAGQLAIYLLCRRIYGT